MTMTSDKAKGNAHGGRTGFENASNVIKIANQTQLPQEFITIGNTFEDALGRCTLRDDKQRSAIVTYKSQLDMFGLTDRVQDLTNWLNASSAIGGINKSLAAMTHTGIYVPEGAGIHLSKQGTKEYNEAQRRIEDVRRNENEKNKK